MLVSWVCYTRAADAYDFAYRFSPCASRSSLFALHLPLHRLRHPHAARAYLDTQRYCSRNLARAH
jgi:hypothetical protein